MAEHGVKDGRWRKPTKGITRPLPEGYQVRKDSRFHGVRLKGTTVAGELEPAKAPAHRSRCPRPCPRRPHLIPQGQKDLLHFVETSRRRVSR